MDGILYTQNKLRFRDSLLGERLATLSGSDITHKFI